MIDKGYFNVSGAMMKVQRELKIWNGSTDNVTRLGRRGQQPILMKFISFSAKLELLRYQILRGFTD
jgi:hypothetical protein